ncbi:hypothetical protein GEV33_006794 [Tenebrio molitor]|uniref:Uncharacterized protein n=1 Tax=Tenebrio molitor TaxID=7067 RepID=A0A8J6HL47_TENMO|nr:hypothetical protein GEV33_006794 [Tenebrio molitor]
MAVHPLSTLTPAPQAVADGTHRALRSGFTLDGLVVPVTAPCAVWDARPARGLHRRRPPRPALQESRGYLPTVNQARMICYIWLSPLAVSTRRAQSTAEPCHEPKMPHPDIRCSGIIPWLPKPAITQLPTHLVTVSPASTSLIHCTTPGSQTIHLPSLSYSYLGQPVGSSCQSYTVPVSPVGLVKITPESRTFQNIIYEPHVWGGRDYGVSVSHVSCIFLIKDTSQASTPEALKQLMLKQLKIDTNKKYSEELRTFALTLNFYSGSAYNYVRSQFSKCLPHPKTLLKWYEAVDGSPGYTKESLRAVELKVKEMEKDGKRLVCSLMMDEMSIRKHIHWNGKGGFNNNPTAIQFESAYKKLLIHVELKSSEAANCLAQDDTSILKVTSTRRSAGNQLDLLCCDEDDCIHHVVEMDDEEFCVPDDVLEEASAAKYQMVPTKSKLRYQKELEIFTQWQTEIKGKYESSISAVVIFNVEEYLHCLYFKTLISSGIQNEVMDCDYDSESDTPPEVTERANAAITTIIPEKSKIQNERAYIQFREWFSKAKTTDTMVYLLKAMLNVKENIDVRNVPTNVPYLKNKSKSVGYRGKKSKILTQEDISKFIEEAADEKKLT